MAMVVGVRFREIGKIYSFNPGELRLHRGDHVITETSKGQEYGTVVLGNYELCEGHIEQPLRTVLRKANAEDEARVQVLRTKEQEALRICRQKAIERKLEMKIISAEYAFDDSKLLFYFTADGRVDFRDLVKDLAAVFHMRIELRQVGVRDETKIIGGMGPCGRPLCCHSWLSDFVPVSIKMAKEQNLSLNPQKISGVCGRLMCCLKNEADTYAYLNAQLPRRGDSVELSEGERGEVIEVNVLKQTVKVLVILDDDEREVREVPAAEAVFIAHKKKGQPSQLKKDAMAKREAMLQESRERAQRKERAAEGSDRTENGGTESVRSEGGRSRRERRRPGASSGNAALHEQQSEGGNASESLENSGGRKRYPKENRGGQNAELRGNAATERAGSGETTAPRPRRRRRRHPEGGQSAETRVRTGERAEERRPQTQEKREQHD